MILVTGASGYLGRFVVQALDEHGLAFTPTSGRGAIGMACDLTDAEQVKRLIDRVQPTCIIHCAANVPKCPAEYHYGTAAWQSWTMAAHVAQLTSASIVLASSMTAADPRTAYAQSKQVAEFLIEHGIGNVIVRLPGLFGLPRRSGALYSAAAAHVTQGTPAPKAADYRWYAMTVADAALKLVEAAQSRTRNVTSEPMYDVATFDAKLAEFVEAVRADLQVAA